MKQNKGDEAAYCFLVLLKNTLRLVLVFFPVPIKLPKILLNPILVRLFR